MNRENIKIRFKVIKKIYTCLSALIIAFFLTNCSTGSSEQMDGSNDGKGKTDHTVRADKTKEVETPADAKNKVVELNENNFDNTVKSGVVLVDFWAPWCGPCRTQGPIIDQLSNEIGNKAVIAKVNVDYNNVISSKYDVKNIPTIIIFKNGKPKMRFVGVQDKMFLTQQIEGLQ